MLLLSATDTVASPVPLVSVHSMLAPSVAFAGQHNTHITGPYQPMYTPTHSCPTGPYQTESDQQRLSS